MYYTLLDVICNYCTVTCNENKFHFLGHCECNVTTNKENQEETSITCLPRKAQTMIVIAAYTMNYLSLKRHNYANVDTIYFTH